MWSLEKIEEGFDPMIGISNFLNSPAAIALAATWLIQGTFKLKNLASNLMEAKRDFISYCNSMGYHIDNEILDSKFKSFIEKIGKIISID